MMAAAPPWAWQARALIGSAKVLIRNLRPERPEKSRKRSGDGRPNQKNVERLIGLFALETCRPLEQANRIPVVLSDPVLQRVLARNQLTIEDLKSESLPAIYLDDGTSLTYLDGLHRLAAGEQFLDPNDQWWGVDLYRSHDLPENVRRDMREHSDSSQKVDDGVIFRTIRYYQEMGDEDQAARWFAKWSANPSKARDFRQLQNSDDKRETKMREMRIAFDKNLPYPGLWKVKTGPLHRILTMWCREESIHYLVHNVKIWDFIAKEHARHVDALTVECLQGRSPLYSTRDRQFVLELFESGELFPSISDPEIRAQLQERVCSVPCIIPSLECFIQNTKIYEPPSKVLRRLLPSKFRGTIRAGLRGCYVHPRDGRLWIQQDEERFYRTQRKSPEFGFWCGYRQLWNFAIRNYPDMTPIKPRISKTPATRHAVRSPAECWLRLGLLATRIGFTSKEIRQLTKTNIALTEGSSHATEEQRAFLTHDGEESWRLETRCGREFDQAFYKDRSLYFLKPMYERQAVNPRRNITSFAVARDIFHAFFGVGFQAAAVEEAGSTDSQPVSPSESPQVDGRTNARRTSPMLVSPSGSSQTNTRQTSPMLVSMSPSESPQVDGQTNTRRTSPILVSPNRPSQVEAQTKTRQTSSVLVSMSPSESPQADREADARQTTPMLDTDCESVRHERSPSRTSPVEKRHSYVLLDDGDAPEVADTLVLPRPVSGATIFPGPESGSGDGAPSFPMVEAAPAHFMVEASPDSSHSERFFLSEPLVNEKPRPDPHPSIALTRSAIDIATTATPQPSLHLLSDFSANRYAASKTSQPVISQPITVLDMEALPPAIPPRNTIFPGRAVLGTSFHTPLAAVSSLDLPVAHSLKLKLPTLLPSTVFVDDPPSASVTQVAIFPGNLGNSDHPPTGGHHHAPQGTSNNSQPQKNYAGIEEDLLMSETPVSIGSGAVEILPTRTTMFPGPLLTLSPSPKDIVLAPSDPSLEVLSRSKPSSQHRFSRLEISHKQVLPGNSQPQNNYSGIAEDLLMSEAPISTGSGPVETHPTRITMFPGPLLTPSPSPGDIIMASSDPSLEVLPRPKSSSQHRFSGLRMPHKQAGKSKEPAKKVQKRARGSVAEKIAMFESNSAFRSTLMPGAPHPAEIGMTQAVPPMLEDNARSVHAETGTVEFSGNSQDIKGAPLDFSNGELPPFLKTPQYYAIMENGKARVLEGSPKTAAKQRKNPRDVNGATRRPVLSQSNSPLVRHHDSLRQTIFPGQLRPPSSPDFLPELRHDRVIDIMQSSFEQRASALESTTLQTPFARRANASDELEDLRHVPKRRTLMPGNPELPAPVQTVFENDLGSAMSLAAFQDVTILKDSDRHFQDEFTLLDSVAEDYIAGLERRESAEDVTPLNEHFEFTSSVEEESFVGVKYHVPAGVLLKFYKEYESSDHSDRLASLVVLPGDQGFDCTFYSQTVAGRSRAMEDFTCYAMQSASYFIADLKKRRYLPQQLSSVKLHIRYGYTLIVHVNQSSFKNEIDFGEHEIQGISIRGALAIPQWNSSLHVWEKYHPE